MLMPMRPPDAVAQEALEYLPFRRGPFRLAMGLAPLDLRDWIAPDARLAIELQEKERLLHERHADIFCALPQAIAASREVLQLLVAHLPQRFPALYRHDGNTFTSLATGQCWELAHTSLHPLDLAGRLVQEDLCVMQHDATAGVYRLVAATVCFPTRWCLADKMGQSVAAIHAPVPRYDQQLGLSMDRFFARLKPARPVWRINWSLLDSPALFQPRGHGQHKKNLAITADNAGDRLWLRLERQTLRRLPVSNDIVFTIRVYVRPLHSLATSPVQAAELAAALRALPASMQRYKSLLPFREAVLAWLDRLSHVALKT